MGLVRSVKHRTLRHYDSGILPGLESSNGHILADGKRVLGLIKKQTLLQWWNRGTPVIANN